LTLNVCIVLIVMWSNPVSNFGEIEQFLAELLWFKYVQFGCRSPSVDQKWIFTIPQQPGDP